MKTIGIIIGIVMLIMAGAIGYLSQPQPIEVNQGGVNRSSEYHSTALIATTTPEVLFKTGSGTFGGLVINTVGTGNIVFYDATTTVASLRAKATSSLSVLATIAASQAVGVWIYDNAFYDGLIAVFNGTQGTSTAIWR